MKALVSHDGVNKFVSFDSNQCRTLLDKARSAFNVPYPVALEYYDAEYKVDVRVEEGDFPPGARLKLVRSEVQAENQSDISGSTV